jgi:hypothetical protein
MSIKKYTEARNELSFRDSEESKDDSDEDDSEDTEDLSKEFE